MGGHQDILLDAKMREDFATISEVCRALVPAG